MPKVANVRLLIIEDEARIAEILRSALSRSGFAVDTVGLCDDARGPRGQPLQYRHPRS